MPAAAATVRMLKMTTIFTMVDFLTFFLLAMFITSQITSCVDYTDESLIELKKFQARLSQIFMIITHTIIGLFIFLKIDLSPFFELKEYRNKGFRLVRKGIFDPDRHLVVEVPFDKSVRFHFL